MQGPQIASLRSLGSMPFEDIAVPVSLRWLAMLLPFALWGTAMAAMKPLLQEISPLTLAWLRILPAALVLLPAAVLLGRRLQVDRRD